ncbi:MAG: tetratricopeptide repeat protein [Candidatus Omnitrophica bacterium]|nr:tetratricopeptide repeat protein [Candidatus Omnitrophota bacterium]
MRFSQVFIISLILLSSISIINTHYIYAEELKEEAGSYRIQGYEAQERGDIDAAITWYQKATTMDPEYAAPYNDLGILFEAKGWLDRAELAYQKALSIDPNYEEAHTNLALLYERKGELEKAAFHWMRRYKLGKPGEAWTEEAMQRLEKLGLLDAKEAKNIKVQRSLDKSHERKKPEARIKKKESRRSKSTSTGEWTRVGHTSISKKGTAVRSVRKKSAAKKGDMEAELQESLRLAEERLRKEKGREPRKEPRREPRKVVKKERKEEKAKAADAEPSNSASTKGTRYSAKSYYSKAASYYRNGEYSRALDTIRTAKRDYPDDASLLTLENNIKNKMKEERIEDHYNEGLMHYRQKDYSGARDEFEAILNILPE